MSKSCEVEQLKLDATLALAEVAKLKAMHPEELDTDEQLRWDMIEGSTSAHEVIERASELYLSAEAMAEATGLAATRINVRAARFQRYADAMRELMHKLLKAAERHQLSLPAMDISIEPPSKIVNIIDIDLVPDAYVKTEKSAKKADIKRAIKAGEFIAGAELVDGKEIFKIRKG